jgi:hypothetical protein
MRDSFKHHDEDCSTEYYYYAEMNFGIAWSYIWLGKYYQIALCYEGAIWIFLKVSIWDLNRGSFYETE